MAVQITDKAKPGDLYLSENGGTYQLKSLCLLPTATLEDMTTGSQTGGGAGCLNLKPFTPIGDCTKEQLIEAVRNLSTECRHGLELRIALKEQICALKEQIFKLKYPEADGH